MVMDYPKYARRRKSVHISTAAAGEDGDFVQLRIVREKRKSSQDSELRRTSEATSSSAVLVEEPEDQYSAPVKRPSTVARNERIQSLRIRLFTAVDQDDRTQIVAIANDINKVENVADVRDPTTDQNVLHYAAANDKTEITRMLISSFGEDLLMSSHGLERSGLRGRNNTLHIVTEKNDTKLAKFLLDKLSSHDQRMKLMKQETAADIKGQRPRLFSCLHLAAFYGHTDLVKLYLNYGIDVNHLNGKEDTALLWASRWGHIDTVSLLLEAGADTEISNDKCSTALYWAIRYEKVKTVALLLQKGNANPNTQRSMGLVSPIIIASAYGNEDIVHILLQHPDTDINIRIRGGERAIHHAAKEGCLGVLQKLIANGANFHDQDDLGATPLLLAAENGHFDVVKYLIRKGANLNHRDHEGHDAWYYAMENEDNELLSALVEASRSTDLKWRQPLCIAANSGKCDKVKFLLKMNIDPMSSDNDGNTFLHHAAMNNKSDVIDQFHETISINVQNKRKNTPLHIACLRGHTETIQSLLRAKAKADIANEKGETALHVAAYSRHITPECAKELVAYTVKTHAWESLNAKDKFGNNCLHIAGKFAKPEVMWEFRDVRFKDRDQDGLTPLHESVRPDEPEALDMMLNIFETMSRDAKINEQSYETSETVLHLAVDECHTNGVKRLIGFGADISIRDYKGNTILHNLAISSAAESRPRGQHIEVLDIIFENVVKWWCIKENIPFPEEENREDYLKHRRDATLFVANGICNNEGLSVLDQAFKVGAADIIQRLLMMPFVTMFENNKSEMLIFDITGLTPRTSGALNVCCGSHRVTPLHDKEYSKKTGLTAEPRLSGVEWLVTHTARSQAAHILDIPPISIIEQYYTSMVAWTFALLMLLHIIYMSVFTYIGVDLLGKLRDDSTEINESDPQTILLYAFVPLEPLLIIIFVVYSVIRYLVTSDIDRRSKLSKKRGFRRVMNIISAYAFILLCFLYAVLVLAWIGLFTRRYEFQDYFLAAAIVIGWILTIAFTRGIRIIHYFYRMLISMIVRDMVRFVIVYLFVLMGFGFAFHILFQVSKDVVQDYETPGDTLFLTFNMMIGMDEIFSDNFETNMSTAGRSTTYIKIVYLFYIILATVILLNLLIAMMNDSYQRILRKNQVLWRIESVALGIEIETNFPAAKIFSNFSLLHGLSSEEIEGLTKDRWYVTVSAKKFKESMNIRNTELDTQDSLSKRLEDLEKRQMEMEKQTLQKLDRLIEMQEKKKKKKEKRHKE